MRKLVYLDYNATTPTDPRVLERMLPYFTERFGNASSSIHAFGWEAEEAVKLAREAVAALLGAVPEEIVFTSGATESVNLALKGAAAAYAAKGRHLVTVRTEHRAVLDACAALERSGFRVTYLPVGPDGLVEPDRLRAAMTDETVLVAVMWANNETGVLQPVRALAEIARERGARFLTDATQAAGKVPVSVEGVDLMALSAHKFYGPKGVGALYVRRRDPRVRLVPLLDGGGQERGLRAGTLNVPGIVGLGAAAGLALEEHGAEAARLAGLRDRLEAELRRRHPDVRVNGGAAPRLPQTSNLRFQGVRAAELMGMLREMAFAAGSACSSASGKPSHVLKALGLTDEEAFSSVRLSLGRFTTDEEVTHAVESLSAALDHLRAPRVGRHTPPSVQQA